MTPEPSAPAGRAARGILVKETVVRLAIFALLFAALTLGLNWIWCDRVSHWLIDYATVRPAASLARLFSGSVPIIASGAVLQAPDGAVQVVHGCEGTDVLFILYSAVLVTPLPWRHRLIGLLGGTVFVFTVNQLRVVGLLFTVRRMPAWFGPMHGTIATLSFLGLVSLFFLLWLRAAMPAPHPPHDAAGSTAGP